MSNMEEKKSLEELVNWTDTAQKTVVNLLKDIKSKHTEIVLRVVSALKLVQRSWEKCVSEGLLDTAHTINFAGGLGFDIERHYRKLLPGFSEHFEFICSPSHLEAVSLWKIKNVELQKGDLGPDSYSQIKIVGAFSSTIIFKLPYNLFELVFRVGDDPDFESLVMLHLERYIRRVVASEDQDNISRYGCKTTQPSGVSCEADDKVKLFQKLAKELGYNIQPI